MTQKDIAIQTRMHTISVCQAWKGKEASHRTATITGSVEKERTVPERQSRYQTGTSTPSVANPQAAPILDDREPAAALSR